MKLGLKMTAGPIRAALLTDRIEEEISKELGVLIRRHARVRKKLVSDWQSAHRPNFVGIVSIEKDAIVLEIQIPNGEKQIDRFSSTTVEDLWTWWEKTGTKAHLIRPVRAQTLRFEIGSRIIFTVLARHPGTQPKEKTIDTNRVLVDDVDPLMKRGIRRVLRHKKSTVKK